MDFYIYHYTLLYSTAVERNGLAVERNGYRGEEIGTFGKCWSNQFGNAFLKVLIVYLQHSHHVLVQYSALQYIPVQYSTVQYIILKI